MRIIGNRILELRKRAGYTQAELTERAGLADRTYADIERGNVNMRIIADVVIMCERHKALPNKNRLLFNERRFLLGYSYQIKNFFFSDSRSGLQIPMNMSIRPMKASTMRGMSDQKIGLPV